ncbi:unnamed protein product (macronuclear) [Paramecium tetraurelia]|uniref:Reelin domain-containing protein n=1 Tax=Paramecium tetraurelia TaxID=5888 RepID=A0C1D6_PARTE|nr:uncharacterized protein GSPATT00034079001 [Paramecium tetraurelia]CAK64603.1 unnamed protein product [Paramecium tetraurelia]|eukprot:XP_001432001.1 hypothetical protein (macronuclear) [Paramecium tetraurelia strain d4-2]
MKNQAEQTSIQNEKFSIFAILVLLQLQYLSSLNFDDPNCMKYLNKFNKLNPNDGLGDIYLVTNSNNAKISLRFIDADLFNDPIYFGFIKEDGKTDDQVCLKLKLWQYTSNKYSDPLKITDLTIIPSNNSEKQWRYYSFIQVQNQIS